MTNTSRDALIKRLAEQWAALDPADPYRADVALAADMLESDVSLINEGNKAQQVAVPEREPLSAVEIVGMAEGIHGAIATVVPIRELLEFARAIEAAHNIRNLKINVDQPTT